jgi:DNA-binding GntR family transcriptional regulator
MKSLTPTPVTRLPLGDEAVTVLREAILDGRLAQGDRVNEVHLSKMLGISRGPLREALRSLERDGLITSLPFRGASIIRVSPEDVMDVLTVRRLLEPEAVRAAMAGGGTSLTEELRTAATQMLAAAAASDPVEVAAAHGRFHSAFYRHSGNQLLARIWRRLEDPVRLYLLRRQSTFGDMSEIASAHERLLSLAEDGATVEAQQEVVSHLTVNIRTIEGMLGPDHPEEVGRDPGANATGARGDTQSPPTTLRGPRRPG